MADPEGPLSGEVFLWIGIFSFVTFEEMLSEEFHPSCNSKARQGAKYLAPSSRGPASTCFMYLLATTSIGAQQGYRWHLVRLFHFILKFSPASLLPAVLLSCPISYVYHIASSPPPNLPFSTLSALLLFARRLIVAIVTEPWRPIR